MRRQPSRPSTRDRKLIGRLVAREIPRHRNIGTIQGLADESRVGRSTIYRVLDGDPRVSSGTLARIEAALGLPPETLQLTGVGDLPGLVEVGCPAELVEWVRKELAKVNPASTEERRKSS